MFFDQDQGRTLAMHTAADAAVGERMAFLKRVYGLLALSVLTAGVGAYFGRALPPGWMFPLFLVELGLIFFAMAVRRKPGWNVFALFAFTTVSGVTLGPVMVVYNAGVVQEALLLTFVIFVGLTGYVMLSKKDFSYLSGFLITGLIVVIVGGLLNIFLFQSPMFEFMLAAGGVVLFSGFILYDTSNILRRYDTDEATSAALALYLDVLNLFLMLLRLLSSRE